MAVVVEERRKSRDLKVGPKSSTCTFNFIITGTTDEQAVVTALLAATNSTYNNMTRTDIAATSEAASYWYGTVDYSAEASEMDDVQGPDGGGGGSPEPEPQDEEEALGGEWSFDISTGTQHITQSHETLDQIAIPGYTESEFERGINVSKDKVEGCDIMVGKLEVSCTIQFPFINLRYLNTLSGLVAHLNQNAWKGWAAGEVLFLGASAKISSPTKPVDVTFKFAVAKNRVDVEVSPDLKFDEVGGWDYVWAYYDDSVHVASALGLQKPVQACRELVYLYGRFEELGLGR